MAEDPTIQILRASVAQGRVLWHHHSLERMIERGITRTEVLQALVHGKVIESDLSRSPFPTFLILRIDEHPLHVVAAADRSSRLCHVITAYRPNLDRFEADFMTRRRRQ